MNENPASLPIPAGQLDRLQKSLERIAAVADLLSCVGDGIDPGLLPPRTIATAASLISEEARQMLVRFGIPQAD